LLASADFQVIIGLLANFPVQRTLEQQAPYPMDVIIYHNPRCGTSRNTLGLIRNAGIEPHVIEYLKTFPSRAMLRQLAARAGVPLRALTREKEPVFRQMGLHERDVTDDELLDALEANPILLDRPIVVTSKGVRLCRPSELVIDLLPPQQGEFVKEDGERIVDERGRRVASA
jgi:arsenate reductase (glutaredoxin)